MKPQKIVYKIEHDKNLIIYYLNLLDDVNDSFKLYYNQDKKSAKSQDERKHNSLRIGECCFETKDLKKALDEFTYVYILGGKSAFENEDKKYFEFFKENALNGKKRKH